MRSFQRPLQLLDPVLLLGIGLRGCASPPKRSPGSSWHFILPAAIEIRSDLILAARLYHIAALPTFQHNRPLLFRGSLDSRLPLHSRFLAEAPSLTNFCVQFYRGALQDCRRAALNAVFFICSFSGERPTASTRKRWTRRVTNATMLRLFRYAMWNYLSIVRRTNSLRSSLRSSGVAGLPFRFIGTRSSCAVKLISPGSNSFKPIGSAAGM